MHRLTPERLEDVVEELGTCDRCGRCCVAVSIHSPELHKPAGERCLHLTSESLCGVWGDPKKQPAVCREIQALNTLCRFDLRDCPDCAKRHMKYLARLERATRPK